MANTLKVQIDNLIGSGLASTLYDDWLVAGARTIVDILKAEDLERHSSSVSVPITTGLSVSGYRIWKVLVGGYDCLQYPAGFETQISDSGSLLRSSAFTPGYIINAGTLKTYNGSNCAGTLIGIAYPSAIDSSTVEDIVGVPENMHHAVILYSSIQGRIKQISSLADSIATAITATLTTLPTPLVSSLDVSSHLTQLETYVVTTEDIELATAKINEIQIIIQNWLQNTAGEVKIELEQSVLKFNAELEQMKTKVASYMQQTQNYALGLQQLQSEYHGLINLYLGLPQGGEKQ